MGLYSDMNQVLVVLIVFLAVFTQSLSGFGSALVAMAMLSACSGKGDRPGVMAGQSNLDAFAVSKRAPLTIPPDFVLVPPKPGAPRPLKALCVVLSGENPTTEGIDDYITLRCNCRRRR